MVNETKTLNWDTVFAIPISKVNQYIIDQKSSPARFSFQDNEGNSISGDFKDWQIKQGGDGSLIWLSLPIKNVSGNSQLLGNYQLESGELIVEVKLRFLDHTDNENSLQKHLKVRHSSETPEDPVVRQVKFTANVPPSGSSVDIFGDEAANAVMSSLIINWLNENLIDFDHVFAIINLNNMIDKDADWAWCTPSYVDYAYSNGPSEDNSLLGVLCMTGGRQAGVQQIQQIDPFVIPENSEAGFIISKERLLKDLILPNITSKWKNSQRSDYEVVVGSNPDTGIYQTLLQLKSGKSIRLDQVKNNGDVYTPYMKNMEISLEGNLIVLNGYTETKVNSDITAWCKTTHKYTLTLQNNKNGQSIIYSEYQSPIVIHGTVNNTPVIEKWIETAIGIIAFGILDILTDGIAFVASSLLLGLVLGTADLEPEIIQSLNEDTSPSIDLLSFNATNPIKWSISEIFKLDIARLNGPFQLGGTLYPSS
ncbi:MULTISPECIES: TULIP family P47-like protein [Bacillaceae]|uniref:TULIP family P47-like protein n=1 Tax=Bacillaceae TaxID=186817 RepID=UPI002A0E5122|nr:TULIP family P47-like protein [Cytobacillus sp. IB215316]MDX8362983.1 TULIP family P47-like protein [Cytobacillus sp. IB215316]